MRLLYKAIEFRLICATASSYIVYFNVSSEQGSTEFVARENRINHASSIKTTTDTEGAVREPRNLMIIMPTERFRLLDP